MHRPPLAERRNDPFAWVRLVYGHHDNHSKRRASRTLTDGLLSSNQLDWKARTIILFELWVWGVSYNKMDSSVILPVEAEGFIQSLETFPLKEVGSER